MNMLVSKQQQLLLSILLNLQLECLLRYVQCAKGRPGRDDSRHRRYHAEYGSQYKIDQCSPECV